MIKKLSIFFCFLCIYLTVFSQKKNDNLGSLDSFFAGVPLKESFEKWNSYVSANPKLGIDSTTSMGNYSSFKVRASHFPFPDSINVKILFRKVLLLDQESRSFTDSSYELYIEGVFGKTKASEKASAEFYETLRRKLSKYYRTQNSLGEESSAFSIGKNDNYPNCRLTRLFSPSLKTYFVILFYIAPARGRTR